MGPVGGQLAPQRDAGAPQRGEAQAELGDAQPEDPDQDPNCANQAFGVINKFQGDLNITETSPPWFRLKKSLRSSFFQTTPPRVADAATSSPRSAGCEETMAIGRGLANLTYGHDSTPDATTSSGSCCTS